MPIRVSKIQLCIVAVLIILAVAIPLSSQYLEYRSGLAGGSPGTSVLLAIYRYIPLIGFLAIVNLVAGLIHVCRAPRPLTKVIIALLLTLVPTIIAFGGLMVSLTTRTEHFLNGFSQWVTANVDLDTLVKWRQSVEHSYWGEHYRYDFPEELPPYCTDFKPKFITFSKENDENSRWIEFSWGGGLSTWGFVISEPLGNNTESGEMIAVPISRSSIVYRVIIRPGIYVFETF